MNLEKKDEDEVYIPFQGLDKGVVLQEKRLFNESPLNPRKCCMLLTKVMYLLVRGQEFTTNEATELFFSVTKLFQSKDVTLRRLVYLVLKELLPLAEDVIIVISCLTKDMNSKTDLYRANSIRVLCKINDVSMLGQTERYLKQAIVDKEPYVASAALVSGVHLMKASPAGVDIVKRWFSEIQSAVKSKAVMVQYHALGLLHQIKRHDRLAVSKLVSEMTRSPVRSHYAHCLLIRFTCQVMNDEDDPSERARLYEYLDSCIRHKSEIVIYEAARGICNLRNVTSKELTPAISALQILLANSQKPTLRFAAVRTLNKVAMTHPLPVTACNLDMENLISDPNRSIATLAITTLLKTGSETSVDRLMKQISNFMNEISDEFKIVVVDAIKTLCLKYKQKHRTLMNFLSNMLRDEGGFQYKKAIVDTILVIIAALPEAKEAGLSHLCEFIEDCEFTALSTKILHLLGKEGPTTSCPPKYIRYIYNRVILESANVRASAVSALANFAVSLPDLQPRIITLLKRCLHDNDDEVRDRATFYLSLLQKDQVLARQLIVEGFPIPLDNLERSLQSYKASPSHIPFDIESVPKVSLEPEKETRATPGLPLPTKAAPVSGYSEALQQIAEFAGLGPLFRSSKPLELTESETEYVVNCVKHVFLNHIVFQFNCTNTLKDQFLEGVTVKMDLAMASNFSLESETSPVSLPYQVPGAFYVCVRHEPDDFATGTFANTLRFSVHEVDPSTGKPDESSYDDDYQLEDIEVAQSDYMKKVASSNFKDEWEALGEGAEYVDKFDLPTFQSLKEAVNEIIDTLGMQPCDNSENVAPKKTQHQLFLSGIFVGEVQVLARVRMILDPAKGVGMQLAVRSSDPAVSKAVGSAF